MKLLVIGGTVFLGRAVVEQALARDCEVTIFHRGVHGPDLFGSDVETLIGDRTHDLSLLKGRSWDAVIDTCGFEPEHVAASAKLLADAVEHYGFVSTGSVYSGFGGEPVDEDSSVFESDEREYGPLKAACERALDAALPGRVLHARAGVIIGPHENIGRLPWWLRRIAAGGEVLAPGPEDAPMQLIDARDLGAWMLDMAGARRGGVFNAITPPGSATWGELLGACLESVGSDASLCWVDGGAVEESVEDPWTTLPLWPIPSLPDLYGMSGARVAEAGLVARALAETVADTWAWLEAGADLGDWRREVQVGGLSAERELELLVAWRH